jgi:hypothetical protein
MKYLGSNFVILKMEGASCSKTFATALDPARRQNPEDSYPAIDCNEEPKTIINKYLQTLLFILPLFYH